jgi:non-ribosomal peptide synthase protein (TIGR01720 family)
MHWLRERGGPIDGFQQSMLLQVPAGLDTDRLTGALQTLLDHHDALRARLVDEVGAWSLLVPPRGTVDAAGWVHRVDAAGLGGVALRALFEREAQAAQRRLAPREGRMGRLVWFDRGPAEPGRLLLMLHHLVVDGVSWRILLPDLAAAWRGEELQPVGTSLRGWTRLLAAGADRREAELPLWQDMLAAPDPLLGARALDCAADIRSTARSLELTLPAELVEPLLTSVPARFGADVNDVLLTGLALAVDHWHERPDGTLVELEGHGREESDGADLSRTVGWFTNAYPVRLRPGAVDWAEVLDGGPALGRALKAVKDQLRAVPDHGLGYGQLRHLDPRTGARLAAHARPQLGFNYLGRFDTAGRAVGADDWSPAPEAPGMLGGADDGMPLAHAVVVNARTEDHPDGPRFTAHWTFAAELLTESRVRELAELWFAALTGLVAHAERPEAGGLSTSDVSLVALSQDEIDAFEDEFGDWDL